MRIDKLYTTPGVYSSNVYLIRGDYNGYDDVNVLIDGGACPKICDTIREINTGAGKKRVDLVILTHNHFDHSIGLRYLRECFNCDIAAFAQGPLVTHRLMNNEMVKAGSEIVQILHTPGHTHDSISIYCPSVKAIFTGDLQFDLKSPGGSYDIEYLYSIEKLAALPIEIIYPGHGQPIKEHIHIILEHTIKMIKESDIIY